MLLSSHARSSGSYHRFLLWHDYASRTLICAHTIHNNNRVLTQPKQKYTVHACCSVWIPESTVRVRRDLQTFFPGPILRWGASSDGSGAEEFSELPTRGGSISHPKDDFKGLRSRSRSKRLYGLILKIEVCVHLSY